MVTEEQQWYVQKGSRVQGPFSTSQVGRYLLLGRVRNTDRVSKDGELWEPVTQVPELIPEELLDLDSEPGWRRFMDSRAKADERRIDVADTVTAAAGIVDHSPERRQAELPLGALEEQQWRQEWQQDWLNAQTDLPRQRTASMLPLALLGITLAGLLLLIYLNTLHSGF